MSIGCLSHFSQFVVMPEGGECPSIFNPSQSYGRRKLGNSVLHQRTSTRHDSITERALADDTRLLCRLQVSSCNVLYLHFEKNVLLVFFCLEKGKCTNKHEREEGVQKPVLFTISPDLLTIGHKNPAASESELSTENAALKDCPGPEIFPLFNMIDLTLPANPIFGLLRKKHRCRLDHYQIQHLERTLEQVCMATDYQPLPQSNRDRKCSLSDSTTLKTLRQSTQWRPSEWPRVKLVWIPRFPAFKMRCSSFHHIGFGKEIFQTPTANLSVARGP